MKFLSSYKQWRASTWVLMALGIAFISGLPSIQTSFGGHILIIGLAIITLVLRKLVDTIAAALVAIFVRYWLNAPR